MAERSAYQQKKQYDRRGGVVSYAQTSDGRPYVVTGPVAQSEVQATPDPLTFVMGLFHILNLPRSNKDLETRIE